MDSLSKPWLNKNAVYGNIGIGGLYFTATGYYERVLYQNEYRSSFIKTGFGGYSMWADEGLYTLAQYGFIFGQEKHHFELGAGGLFGLAGDMKNLLNPSLTVGWRVQKPESKKLFRLGVSIPEAIYVGFGRSF